ncbi:MAG: Xaa-Pro dipeptidyl-peptidase [Gemmatimonadetes bacterium]|nr:Xaa-Pro dipeptidyl-peptidase [Gemmatimonadota bacterium]
MRQFAVLFVVSLPMFARAQDGARPQFANGVAQVVPAFADSSRWIRQRLWVETEFDSDGDGKRDRVHVDVTRPGGTANGLKLPVVYESSPYYAGTSGPRNHLWNVQQEVGAVPPARTSQPEIAWSPTREWISDSHVRDWVPRGFAVVHSESPGTGLSQGCPTVGGANESLAPKAVIDWLNGRARGYTARDGGSEVRADWASGKVGMTGTSFNGTLPVAAATTGVAGLEVIIPVAPNTSYWHYYRSFGLVRHPGGWLGEDIDFLYDFINSGDPARRAWCNEHVREQEMHANQDRRTGDWNAWWASRDYVPQVKGIKAAVLMSHAWNDWNVMPEHSVRVVEALQKQGTPVAVYYHQGGHGGAPPLEMMNRWFTRYLLGVENGVEKDPKSWIVREGQNRMEPTPYPAYPHPEAREVALYPAGAGRGRGELVISRRAGQGKQPLVDNVAVAGDSLARSTTSEHRLLFATPELTEALHLSGTARLTVRVASDRPAANFSVWLVALPWTDAAPRQPNFSVITRGWADLQNRRSLSSSEPLVPGEFVEMTFTLQPDDQVIPAGKRIGLMLFSSDRDFTLWPRAWTTLTVDLDGTSLVLPLVGGAEALRRATGGR